MKGLLPAAITIAVLGAIESLLSATVADGVTGDKHNSNQELMAQGIANVVTPLFGGIPATGAIARTMTNINNGGRTPVAGVIHAVVLLLIFLFLMPLAQYIPMLGCRGAVGHLPADGHHRPDGGHRSRTGTRLPALHAARDGNYRHLGHPQRNRPR